MARILGLDMGTRTVKALVLESSLRGFTLRGYHEAPVEEGTGLAGALASLRAGDQLAADQVVVAVPGASVATHLITLPFTDAKRIDSTIAFEVEAQLPYDLAEAVFDYHVLGVRDGKSDVLVSALRKEELTAFLQTLAAAGIDPRVVTTSALAYQALLAQALTGEPGAPPPGDAAEAIVDIGHTRTSVCIAHAGSLEYARTFAGGGADLTRVVASEFKVSLQDAEAWKNNEGDVTLEQGASPESEKAAAALLRGLTPIVREVRATLRAHAARFRRPVARIYLAGGTARLKGLGALLSRELCTEVRPLDPIPRANSPVPAGCEPLAAQAFALALRGHGAARAARFNLRKGDFAFKGDLDYLKGKTSRIVAFSAVLLVLTMLLVWSKLHVLGRTEAELDRTLCTTTQRVVGQCQKNYDVALSLLKGKGSPAASLPTYSSVDLLAEVTSRAGALKSMRFDDVSVQLDRVQLHGETESFDGVDQLVGALKGFKCFQETKRGKVQKSKDGSRVQFDLDIRVQCGPEAPKAEGA